MSGLKARGFSLLELMLVLVIVALLGALAWPGYQRHLAASRRVIAIACLLESAQTMERYRAAKHSYQDAPDPAPCREVAAFYQLSFAGAPSATGYVLQAVPQAAQALHDAQCGTLSINQAGERTPGGADSVPMQCW